MLPIDKRTALSTGSINYQTSDFYQENTYVTINGNNFRSFKPAGKALADADIGFTKHTNPFEVIANGLVITNNTAGVSGKLEKVADPDDAGKNCWLMSINKADADSQGTNSKRAEFGFTYTKSLVPINEDIVLGSKFRIGDYRSSLDNFLILQLWSAPTAEAWSPPFSLNYENGIFCVIKRYGLAANAQIESYLYQNSNLSPNVWHEIIVTAKFSELVNGDIASNGYLNVYLDGIQIVKFAGKIGYGGNVLLKSGLYQWNAPTNWDNNYLTKTMYTKGPYLSKLSDCSLTEMQSFMSTL